MKEHETPIIAAYVMGMVSFVVLVVNVLICVVFYLTTSSQITYIREEMGKASVATAEENNRQQREIEMLQTQVSIMERQIDVVKIKEKEG